jgi:hypothetical protein
MLNIHNKLTCDDTCEEDSLKEGKQIYFWSYNFGIDYCSCLRKLD